MEVINRLLNYKNLKIVQNTDWFNFSLDSVLLCNFVTLNKNTNSIIDFCTGNAPIPLILSQKTDSNIIGVEIQKEIYSLAKKSTEINSLEDRIKLLNMDVKELTNIYETDSFDLITCNPPYFKVTENSNLNNNTIKTKARHEIDINLEDILKLSKYLLKNNGNLALVHRPERLTEILLKMKEYNIEPKKIQFVYPKRNSESNILLIEGTKNGNPGLKVLPPLYVHSEDGKYLDEILNMFQ